MGNRERVDYTLSSVAIEAIKGIQFYSGKAGFPDIKRASHAVDLAVIEFFEQLKAKVDKNNNFPFLTKDKWK